MDVRKFTKHVNVYSNGGTFIMRAPMREFLRALGFSHPEATEGEPALTKMFFQLGMYGVAMLYQPRRDDPACLPKSKFWEAHTLVYVTEGVFRGEGQFQPSVMNMPRIDY